MKKTPLHTEYESLKAKVMPFAGYEMPLNFSSIKEEYSAVRKQTGLFDVSHMVPIAFRHQDSQEIVRFLNHLTCREINQLHINRVQYNAFLNENGGVIDDITIFRPQENVFLGIVNAANSDKVMGYLSEWKKKLDTTCQITPLTDYTLLALQGPDSAALISEESLFKNKLDGLFYYECSGLDGERGQNGFPAFIGRTGYTGEDGFEILVKAEAGVSLWKSFIRKGAVPCGLAVRDLLRMEVFYPLYGNELSEDKTPTESGIGWLISSSKDFLGKDNVMSDKESPSYKTLGFQLLEAGVPRKGFEVCDSSGNKAGSVTSGSFSFGWNCGFGIAYIKAEFTNKPYPLFLKIRGDLKPIKLFKKSPYEGSILRRQP